MRAVAVLAVVVVVGGLYAYSAWDPTSTDPGFHTAPVERCTVVSTAVATGTLEPVVTVLVGSQVSGTVIRWYADFNQEVAAGFILAELDQEQIRATIDQRQAAVAMARAGVSEMAARLSESELELDRIQRAYDVNGASDFERAKARAAVVAATAAQRAAEAQVLMAEAELRAGEIQLNKTIIRAPIDGMVISRDIDAGQTVAASLSAPTLFTIAQDLRQMRVSAAVSETDIGRVAENMAVSFRVDAYPERRFSGRVSQIRFAETVVDSVVTYETLIDVENPELLLRPGMTATITFEVARETDTLAVPNGALRFNPDQRAEALNWRPGRAQPMQPRVYKLVGQQLVAVDVALGVTDGAVTAVRSDGLREGDLLVTGRDPDRSAGRRRSGFF